MLIEAGKEYPARPFDKEINLESLQIKQSLLPEGPDISRASPNEIRELLALDNSLDLGVQPIDNFYDKEDSDSGIRALGSGSKRLIPEFAREDAERERAGEIWDIPIGDSTVEVVAEKAVKAQRDKENMAFSDRWVISRTPGVEGLIHIVPDAIAINGTLATIQGRYNEFSYFRVKRQSKAVDPNGWKILAILSYDFVIAEGTIILE